MKKPRTYIFPNDLGYNTNVRNENMPIDNSSFHFMLFSIISVSENKTVFSPSYPRIRDTNNKTLDFLTQSANERIVDGFTLPRISGETTYQKQTESNIILYMPDEIKVNYSAEIDKFDQFFMREYIQREGLDKLNAMKNTVSYGLGNIGELAAAAIFGMTGAISALDAYNLALAKRGKAFNPASEQLFRNMKMREFNYTFQLVPRNKKESETIQNIIKEFKFHMHPELTSDKFEFLFPSLFVITYWRASTEDYKEYSALNKISACFLEDMTVNYSGSQKAQFNTFHDGQPVETLLTLKFRETVIQTKESINKGF